MKKRMVSFVLAMVMVFCLIPTHVQAEENIGLRPLNGDSYTEMTTSQRMLDMIKDMEGFSAKPYWDVNQWSIGYGTSCGRGSKPDLTVTREEAEEMLVEILAEKYGKAVNDFCASIGRQPNQQQFDALVDFTYNLGTSWTSGCALATWLKNPTTEMDFVNAIGRWGRISSVVNYSTCMRRIREAIVFLRGEYYLPYGNEPNESGLSVVSNRYLPYYKVVIFHGNGGTFGSLSDEIRYYAVGEPFGAFPAPEKDGCILTGWRVTAENNWNVEPYNFSAGNGAEINLELEAVWSSDSYMPEPETTAPEETEPETTAPEETEPETTAPEETEPETTAPEETEPETTAPEETEPETTAPEETEPETTAPEETEPETTVPEETEPETTAPEETEPETTAPEETEPETTAPEETEPETTVPEETEPETTAPEETEPETTAPEETEPETTAPEETEPETTVPEETEPETTAPEETEPEVTEPEETEPEVTEPEETEPAEPEIDEEEVRRAQEVLKAAWYRNAVETVRQNGTLNGSADAAHNSGKTMTSGVMTTFLNRMTGRHEVIGEAAYRTAEGQIGAWGGSEAGTVLRSMILIILETM